MLKLIKRILVITLCAVLFICAAFSASAESVSYEEKDYCSATLDQDFDDSCVLVVMDKNVSGINKKFDKSFFGNLPIESIVDLTEITGDIESKDIDEDTFRQILKLNLSVRGKENVLMVIKELEKIDGVKSASPNYIRQPNTTSNGISSEPVSSVVPVNSVSDTGIPETGDTALPVYLVLTACLACAGAVLLARKKVATDTE